MAVPTYGSVGAASGGSGAIAPAFPATVDNLDIAILVVETANQPVATPSGWTIIEDPGTGVAAAADAICMQAFWLRCDGSEDGTTVAIADAGDHQTARIFTVVGCIASGDPVHISNSDVNAVADTAYSAPGFTTTQSDCLVIAVLGRSNDSGLTTSFSGAANADLGSVTEEFEWGTGTGNGGGGVVISGTMAVAGAVGATTATGPSATQANLQFALLSTTSTGGGPTDYPLTADAGSYTLTGTAAGVTAQRKIAAAVGSYALTGTAATLRISRRVVAAGGLYALTGTAAGLVAARRIVGAVGSYTLTGTVASLATARRFAAAIGNYVLTGADVTLTYTPAGVTYELMAASGSYILTGSEALFTRTVREPFVRNAAPAAVSLSVLANPGSGTFVRDQPPPSVITQT